MRITIEPTEGVCEDQEWHLLSFQGLEEAYDDAEPKFSVDRIKIPNPDDKP